MLSHRNQSWGSGPKVFCPLIKILTISMMLQGGCQGEPPTAPIGVRSQPLNRLEEPLPQEPSEPVGAIPASFEVTPYGDAQYSIPLWISPGRRGLQPRLALVYHSASNRNGQLGMGWSLQGLSKIYLCGRTQALGRKK
jgi:hypothetical protein